ncbi:MAG: CoA transferase [Candidatus Binatia bacterium]|nr:MAG: CoA transferase [Candidatus Binatia bacterium]
MTTSRTKPTETPLEGVRVVEWSDGIGDYCGRLLAAFGAQVTKVEFQERDRERSPRDRAFYDAGKRRVVVAGDGREEILALCRDADVFLRAGEIRHLEKGPDVKRLGSVHPGLLVVTLTPFGLRGRRSAWHASELTVSAAGGMLTLNGAPGEPPPRPPGPQAWHVASLYAALGTVAALQARESGTCFPEVSVSAFEAVVASVEPLSATFPRPSALPRRRGTLHWNGAFRLSRAKDGWVVLSLLGDWTALVEWLRSEGAGGELAKPEWEDLGYRLSHAEEAFSVLGAWARGKPADEIEDGARLRRLPMARVRSMAELPENPHLRARGFSVGGSGRACPVSWVRPRPLAGVAGRSPSESACARRKEAAPARKGETSLPLAGLRVVDFTWLVAGPLATRILADLGADVVKVERRDVALSREKDPTPLDCGKRSLVLDMEHPRGREIALELLRTADVVVDNFAPRVFENWGFLPERLLERFPRLVVARLSAFGANGPWRDHVAYGPTLQALAGFTDAMRSPGGEPRGWGYAFSDMVAGVAAAFAIVCALRLRNRTGRGSFLDLSQFEILADLLGPELSPAARSSEVRGFLVPAGPDAWLAVDPRTEAERRILADVAGVETGGEFSAASSTEKIRERLARRAAEEPPESLLEALRERGVPAARVASLLDLLEDPDLLEAGFWQPVAGTRGRTLRASRLPLRFPGFRECGLRRPPRAGEHTGELLGELLGLSRSEIESLRRSGAVG